MFSVSSFSQTLFIDSTPLASELMASGSQVYVFDKSQIDSLQNLSLRDLLETRVTGVSFSENSPGGTQSVFFRGANSNHILVLLDGIVINDPSDPSARFDFSQIDLSAIESVEVYKGATSSLYGSGAIGGVIYLHSTDTKSKQGDFYLDDLMTWKYAVTASDSIGKDRRFRISYSHEDKSQLSTKGGRSKSLEADPYKKQNLSVGYKHQFGASELLYHFRKMKNQQETDSSTAQDEEDFVFNENDLHQIKWSHKKYAIGVQSKKTERQSFYNSKLSDFNAKENSIFIEAGQDYRSLQWQWRVEAKELSGRFEAGKESRSREEYGVAAQVKTRRDAFTLTSGVRADSFSVRSGTLVTGNLGLEKQSKAWLTGFNLKSSFRYPSLYELYSSTFGNQDLQAEKAKELEIYLKLDGPDTMSEALLSLYKRDVDQLIDLDASYTRPYENIGKASIEGLELRFKRDWTSFKTFLSFAFLTAKDLNSGKRLLSRPDQIHSLRFEKALGRDQLHLDWIYYGTRLSYGQVENDSYDLASVAYLMQLKKNQKLGIKVENLFNRSYEEVSGYTTKGRSFSLSYQTPF